MNASEATKQLLRHLALKLGPSEIELKLVVSVNITVTGLSWVDYNLELNAPQFQSLWDERQWVVTYCGQWRPSCFARWQQNSPALIFHAYTAWPSGEVHPEALVIIDKASYCGPVQCPYTRGQCGRCINYQHQLCHQTMTPFDNR